MNESENLFRQVGESSILNDRQQITQPEENITTTDEQLASEVGSGGVILFNRRGRIRITDTGPVREQGCSSVNGFFDASSERADEVLF